VLNSSTRQVGWKPVATVRPGFAFLLRVRGLVRRGLCFRLFFLSFRRGISGAFLLGQLFPRFRRRLSNPRLQFLGINPFGSRTKEASFVNGHGVLQIAPNTFELLDLSLQRLLVGLQRLDLLAQAPVLLRQPFLWGRAH